MPPETSAGKPAYGGRYALHHLELEEKLWAAEELQRQLSKQGLVPDTRKLLIRRMNVVFRVLGGILVALQVAIVAVVGAFLVFNKLLHIGSSH